MVCGDMVHALEKLTHEYISQASLFLYKVSIMGLLEFYAEIIIFLTYLAAIISSAIYFCQALGIWTWALIGIELAPEIIIAVHINDVREKIRIEGLLKPCSNVNIDEQIDDYIKGQKKH
jgi:hypothetical protein